jgi:hypothetical protein
VEVTDREFKDVSLLESGHVLTLRLETVDENVLELVQASIDSSPSLAFQQWLRDLEIRERREWISFYCFKDLRILIFIRQPQTLSWT